MKSDKDPGSGKKSSEPRKIPDPDPQECTGTWEGVGNGILLVVVGEADVRGRAYRSPVLGPAELRLTTP
jgi:hypothetical protein